MSLADASFKLSDDLRKSCTNLLPFFIFLAPSATSQMPKTIPTPANELDRAFAVVVPAATNVLPAILIPGVAACVARPILAS